MNAEKKEEYLREFILKIFEKYDTENKGFLTINELCLFFNDLFQSLGVQLTINAYQAISAIKIISPEFTDRATKEQAFLTFKSLINYSENKQPPQPTQVPVQQMQMQNSYPMQMMGGYNPMGGQFYPQSQFGYGQGQQYGGQYQQGPYQWPYGNFQNNFQNYQR